MPNKTGINYCDCFSEKEIVNLLRQGDERALRHLYAVHIKQLHYFVLRIAKSKQLTEDVIQDVFIKVWNNRLQIDPNQPFKPYLYTIARHQLLNLLKRARHESYILEEIRKSAVPAESTTEMQVAYNESYAILKEAINVLPLHCREVFIRCKIEGLSYRQVSDELGIAEGTVNSQMVKALRSIKQFISIKNALRILPILLHLLP